MIVDDDDDIRETLRELLEDSGFTVVLAANGGEALALLGTIDACLLLLDLRMPVMDGWAFLREIEKRGAAHPPIYISTSSPASAPPGYPILSKPIDIQRILNVAQQHCA
ncbi:MAG: response regulator [Myxococcota bacterium]|nr:response regulator [Myxococcota bacterium]